MNVYKYGVEIESFVQGNKLIAFNSISCMMEKFNPEFPKVPEYLIICGNTTIHVPKDDYKEIYELYRGYLQRR